MLRCMPLKIGTRLGPYEILAAIGSGGMGEVYRARDTRLEREVALKILPSQFASDSQAVNRFERETRSIAVAQSPRLRDTDRAGTGSGARKGHHAPRYQT